MKKILLIPFLFFSLAAMGACSADEKTSDPETPDQPAGNSNILVAYFSATGNRLHSCRALFTCFSTLRTRS